MKYDPSNVRAIGRSPQPSPARKRRSIRLRGYDYSRAGAYFITICTQNRQCLFGEIVDGGMRLNAAGKMVADEWMKTAIIRQEIELDEWVVMPNHFHGILVIDDARRKGVQPVASTIARPVPPPCRGDRPVAPTGPQPRSIGAVMAGFKSAVTKRINQWRNTPGARLWQRNYWEHVVRNESELNRIREYIRHNPAKWELDKLHPNSSAAPTKIRESSATYGRPASLKMYGRPAGRPYDWEEWMI